MERGLAWIEHRDQRVLAYPALHGHPAFSAPVQLVQGAYHRFVGAAHLVLRQRIFTTSAHRLVDAETVRLGASKITFDAPVPAPADAVVDVTPDARRAQALADDALPRGLIGRPAPTPDALRGWVDAHYGRPPAVPSPHQPRRVLALLVERGRVTWAAANDNGTCKIHHAEVLLVQSHWRAHRRPLPAGAEVWVSRRCCRMCAAVLFASAAVPAALVVRYLEDDPGRYAQNTVLQARGQERGLTVDATPGPAPRSRPGRW